MSAPTSPPTAPSPAPESEPEPRPERPVVAALWVVALVLGLILAVLGVNAAIASVQRKQYFEARVAAVFLLSNGNAIDKSMQRLHEVNVRDYNLLQDGQSALEAGDTSLFNRHLAQADVFSLEQGSLQDQVQKYKVEFDKALKR
ncbi:MAG: hypothetical protein ABI903_13320 [Actinomycetota bacterium]